MIVIDASVAVKWYVREISSDQADALLLNPNELVAPDFFVIEVAAALVRKANMNKDNRIASETGLASFTAMLECGVVRTESTQLADLMAAARLALDLGHPIKDCIYLALAMKLGCELLTSDRRFAAKAEPVWPKVRVLEG